MLNSGPRSYYDDYLRKKGTGRVVEDPTALLTDRNAYVNFLEVQLERVSAACLAVQSVEQRFSDLTGMIQTLEQRCTANIKLIGLSQQCTEQVRAETDRKFELLVKQQNDDRENFERTIRQLSIQLGKQERKLEQYEPLQQRVTENEHDIISLNNELTVVKEHLLKVEEEKNKLAQQLEEERENRLTMENQLVGNMNSNQQKILSIIDEHHEVQSQMYQQSVDRFQQLFNEQQESLIEAQLSHRRHVDSSVQKQNDAIEQTKLDFVNRLNTHYESLSQEMMLMKESIQEEIDTSILRSVETSEELQSTVKSMISTQLEVTRVEILSDIEEKVSGECQRVLDEYISLAQTYEDADNSVTYPAAPTPSVANSMDPRIFGMMRSGSIDDADATQQRGLGRSMSATSQIKRVPSTMSEKSQELYNKVGSGRQELDAIHNTLQALLEMHRQDVLSIHHRLDAMQVPLGVAPAKTLSRRNSVMSQSRGAEGGDLYHQQSMQTIDANVSALTMKSFLSSSSKDSRASSNQSIGSKSQKSKVKAVYSINIKPEAERKQVDENKSTASSSKLSSKKKIQKKDASSDIALSATAAEKASGKASTKKKRLSFAKTNNNDSVRRSSVGDSILNLSDDNADESDSSSDYEDVAQPYDLSGNMGNMSFISNKSKGKKAPSTEASSLPMKQKPKRDSNSVIRPTQSSSLRHPTSAGTKTFTTQERRKAPLIVAAMPVVRKTAPTRPGSASQHATVLKTSFDNGSILSSISGNRQQWKPANTYVSSAAAGTSKSKASSRLTNAQHSHDNGACGGCAPNPTGSIKDTVITHDGCCRYCGKDLEPFGHHSIDKVDRTNISKSKGSSAS